MSSESKEGGGPGAVTRALGFPLHALLVIFPMGALLCGTAFDVASHLATEPYTFPRSAFWLIVLGLVGSVVSGGAGLTRMLRLEAGSEARRTGVWHVAITDVSIVLFVGSLLLRRNSNYSRPVGWGPLALGLAGSLAVVLGAALGARLTYRYRIGASGNPP